MTVSPDKVEKILDLHASAEAPSYEQIARQVGKVSRNQVSSVVYRARKAGDPRARYRKQEPEMEATERKLILAISEINEATRDLALAALMPDTNQKVSKIAGCVAGYARACTRLQDVMHEIDLRMNPSKFEAKSVEVIEGPAAGTADSISGAAEQPYPGHEA